MTVTATVILDPTRAWLEVVEQAARLLGTLHPGIRMPCIQLGVLDREAVEALRARHGGREHRLVERDAMIIAIHATIHGVDVSAQYDYPIDIDSIGPACARAPAAPPSPPVWRACEVCGAEHAGDGPMPCRAEDLWTATLCPQCGPDVAIDEDGCCAACGCVAVGEGIEAVLARLRAAER